jgi:integrase
MPGHTYKRGDIWWIKFSHQGKTYYTSSKSTKQGDAKRLLSMYLGEIAAGTFKGLKKDLQQQVMRLPELLDDFEAECKRRKLRALDRITSHLNAVREFFGDIPLAEITERHIDLFIKHRLGQGRSTTTVNRGLQYLGQALRRAKKKQFIAEVPLIEKFSEKDNARQGFFDKDSFERVIVLLPEELQDFVRFAYYSGWRKGEINQLEWRDVHDGVIRLRPEISKNKDGRVLAIVGEIAAIIARRHAVRRSDVLWVFYRFRKGKYWPVGRFDKVWKKACAKAGAPDRLFHDFRRTTVRNMTRAGVPEKITMNTTGHKTRAIFDRYNIVREDDIRQGQLKTEQFLAGGYNLVTEKQES